MHSQTGTLVAAALLLSPTAAAQITIDWRNLQADANPTFAWRGVVDSLGNSYVVVGDLGTASSPSEVDSYAPNGALRWSVRVNASAPHIALGANDELVLWSSDGSSTLVARFDHQGQLRWRRNFAATSGASLAMDSLDRAVLAGNAAGDWIVRAIANDGSTVWTTNVDDPAHLDDTCACVAIDAAGGVFVGGQVGVRAALAKLTAGGALTWLSVFNAPYDSAQYARVVSDGQGGAIAAGNLQFTVSSPVIQHFVNHQFTHFDSQGNILWLHPAYGIQLNSGSSDVIVDGAGAIWAAIQIDPYAFMHPSVELERLAFDGSQLAQFDYDGPSHESAWPAALALDDSGRVLLAATSGYYFGSQSDRSELLRIDDTGHAAWTKVFGASGLGVRTSGIVRVPGHRLLWFGERTHGYAQDTDALVMQLSLNDP